MKQEQIALTELDFNTGQIKGLPTNPRQWTRDEVVRLAASIKQTPELLEARGLIVYPHGGRYVILGGNMRYEALRHNRAKTAPCIVFPEDTPLETLKEIVIKDNGSFGSWDYDALANEWDDLPLPEWGVPVWDTQAGTVEDIQATELSEEEEIDDEEKKEPVEKIPAVEALLDDAMVENVREFLQQVDILEPHGWLCSGMTVGLAKLRFLRALYYGDRYPQKLSTVFHPHQFHTSAEKISYYDQLVKIARGDTRVGVPGFRTQTSDGSLTTLLSTNYPIGSARMPLDFPNGVAKELILEFGGPRPAVLDPCHGWGGRFVGALLAGARSYVGCDPSKLAHAGLERMRDAFLGYCKDRTESAEFILSPYEDCTFSEGQFDIALTSPPYFDVELYEGADQSHVKYPKYDGWKRGFYTPLIENTYKWLKPGAVFALQVGSQSYPLLKDGKSIATSIGFTIEDVRPFGGATTTRLHGNEADETNECILILRKPAEPQKPL